MGVEPCLKLFSMFVRFAPRAAGSLNDQVVVGEVDQTGISRSEPVNDDGMRRSQVAAVIIAPAADGEARKMLDWKRECHQIAGGVDRQRPHDVAEPVSVWNQSTVPAVLVEGCAGETVFWVPPRVAAPLLVKLAVSVRRPIA